MGLHCSGGDRLVKTAFGPSFGLGFHSHLDYHSTIWILPQVLNGVDSNLGLH